MPFMDKPPGQDVRPEEPVSAEEQAIKEYTDQRIKDLEVRQLTETEQTVASLEKTYAKQKDGIKRYKALLSNVLKIEDEAVRKQKLTSWQNKFKALLDVTRTTKGMLQQAYDPTHQTITQINSVLAAYEEKERTGQFPEGFTSRPYDDREIKLFKKIRTIFKENKDLASNMQTLEALGVNIGKDGNSLVVGKKEGDFNAVFAFVGAVWDDAVNRVMSTSFHLGNWAMRRFGGPMSNELLASRVPGVVELQNQQLRALQRGDSEEVLKIGAKLEFADKRERLAEAAESFELAKKVFTAPSQTLRTFGIGKDSELTLSNFKPEYKDSTSVAFSVVKTLWGMGHSGVDLDNASSTELPIIGKKVEELNESISKREQWLAKAVKHYSVAINGDFDPKTGIAPINDPKLKLLAGRIEKVSRDLSRQGMIKSALEFNPAWIPALAIDLAMPLPIGPAIRAAGQLTKITSKVTAKTALTIGRAAAIKQFGQDSILLKKFDFAEKVVDGQASLYESERFSEVFNKWFNRYEGLDLYAGGKKAVFSDVGEQARTIDAAREVHKNQLIGDAAKVIGDNAHLMDKKYRPKVSDAFVKIADYTRENIIKTGEAFKRITEQSLKKSEAVYEQLNQMVPDLYRATKEAAESFGGKLEEVEGIRTPGISFNSLEDLRKGFVIKVPKGQDTTAIGKLYEVGHELGHALQIQDKAAIVQVNKELKDITLQSLSKLGATGVDTSKVVSRKIGTGPLLLKDEALLELASVSDPAIKNQALELIANNNRYRKSLLELEEDAHNRWKIFIKDRVQAIDKTGKTWRKLEALPSFKETELRAVASYRRVAEGKPSLGPVVRPTAAEDIEQIRKQIELDFDSTFTRNGGDIDKTAKEFGVDLSDIDFSKRLEETDYIKGYDKLSRTGILSKARKGILANPTYGFTESEQKTLEGIIDLYRSWGEINAEAKVVGMVMENYTPRQVIDKHKGIFGRIFSTQRNLPQEIGTELVYPSWQAVEQSMKAKGLALNEKWDHLLVRYAEKTSRNKAVADFEKAALNVFPELTPAHKQFMKYLKEGSLPITKAEKIYRSLFLKPAKMGLLAGHISYNFTNAVDDFVRTLFATGGESLSPKLLKESIHAYNATAGQSVKITKDLVMPSEQLSELMWRYGVFKLDNVAGDLAAPSGVRLLEDKLNYGYRAKISKAVKKSPLILAHPDASMHANNIFRGKVFLNSLRKEMAAGKSFEEAAYKAREQVALYLIDNNESGRLMDLTSNFIPFIRYQAKTLSAYAKVLKEQPELVGKLSIFMRNSSHLQPSREERQHLSPYMNELFAYTLGRDKLGNQQFLTRLGLSYEAINDILSTAGPGRTLEKLAGQVMPLQILYAITAEKHPFFGVPFNHPAARKAYSRLYSQDRDGFWDKVLGGVSKYPAGTDNKGNTLWRYEYDDPKRAFLVLGPGLLATTAVAHRILSTLGGEQIGSILAGQLSPRGQLSWNKLSDESKELTTRWLNYLTSIRVVSVDMEAQKLGNMFNKLREVNDIFQQENKSLEEQLVFFSTQGNSEEYDRARREMEQRIKRKLK